MKKSAYCKTPKAKCTATKSRLEQARDKRGRFKRTAKQQKLI